MSDRDFAIIVRRALLMIVDAIDRRWGLGKYKDKEPTQKP